MFKSFFKKDSDKDIAGLTDFELITNVKKGSKGSWRELVNRHYGLIASTVFKITGGRDAEDVIQETLIQLFYSLPSFRNDSAFSTFLYRLALNTACRETRKMTNSSSIVAVGDDIVEKLMEGDGGADETFENIEKKELASLVDQAMSKIPADFRLYLTLFFVEELTLREISEIFKVPLTTVASRIKRGKLLLLKEIEKLQ